MCLVAGSTSVICAEKDTAPQAPSFSIPISDDQKILHALNRLTFGPRPGDMEEVQKMGLPRWIDLQLHPGRIPEDPLLAAKLQPLDTLRMSPAELVRSYPPPNVIKAIADGQLPYPSDPEQRALIENLVRRYKLRNAEGAYEKPSLDNVGLTDEQQRALLQGTPAEKLEVYDSLLDEQKAEVLEAIPPRARIQLFSASPPELRRRMEKAAGPLAVITLDLTEGKLLRAVYSHRQLQEVLTDFWYNHFNVFLNKGADRYLAGSYERDVIQPHVLGKFKDLLVATAQSPAMLFYLDNFQSFDPAAARRLPRFAQNSKRKFGINENYARELMELHTLGVDGGYTQRDVTEVARCFTGWSIDRPRQGGGFIFRTRLHDRGEKTVLGVRIPAGGGMEDGLKVLDILAHHPSTAQFISKKLAMRFVADDPPQSLVDKMARTFRDQDGDIRAVLETMLQSPEFWSAGAYRAKLKSPLEMLASAVRALDANVEFSLALGQQLNKLGEPLYRKQEPTGYSNASQEWVNSAALLARMNLAIALAANRVPGVKVDPSRFEGDNVSADAVAQALSIPELSATTRAAIDKALNNPAPPAVQETGEAQMPGADAEASENRMSPEKAGARRGGMPALGLLPPRPVPKALTIAGLELGSPDFQRK
ncbi:MAG TPA: DUF1800 domain-containing protein [Bryobacteraceae bacterium]|nr:DUF1800 domain-containing protein [Bryobacteraceae bacterium]